MSLRVLFAKRSSLRLIATLFLFASLLLVCTFTLAQTRRPLPNNPLAKIERDIDLGRLAEAERQLFDYAVANPRDVRALELLAGLRLQQNRLSEAEALYRRVLAIEPARDQAKVYLAHVLFKSARQLESRDLFVEVSKSTLSDPRLRMSLAEGLLLVGEFEKSLAAAGGLPPAWKNAAALPVIAASELALGHRQNVRALIPAMLRGATNPLVAVRCIQVLQNAGLSVEAMTLARKALTLSPNDLNVLLAVAQLELTGRNFAEARKYLNRAALLHPRSSEVFSTMAIVENAEGNPTAALSNLQRARTLSPESSTVLGQLAVTAMRVNQAALAVEVAKDLLTREPNDPEALYLFGAASLQNGGLVAARDALEQFVKKQPNDVRGCLALGITIAAEKTSVLAARSQFEHCLQLDATNVEAKYQLGLLSKSEGETANAIKLFEDVITRAPNHANALRDLGSMYLQSNDAAKARSALERAVALNDRDPETHFLLSRVYNRVGESALATRHLELFQKLKSQREKPSTP